MQLMRVSKKLHDSRELCLDMKRTWKYVGKILNYVRVGLYLLRQAFKSNRIAVSG
jgi:hypothetical protein